MKLLFVTGKGGVGKSTLAAALALKNAKSGNKTLLVELGDQSYFENWLSIPIGHDPTSHIHPNLFFSRWEASACLKEYLTHYLKVETLVNLFFQNKVMKTLLQAAPALKEISLLGKITSGIRKIGPPLVYDCVVIDCFSTGHFKALIQAPKGLSEAVKFGPMGEQCRSILNVIKDKTICSYHLVCLPEELPVIETKELEQFLKSELGVEPLQILNRMWPIPPVLIEGTPYFEFLKARQQSQKDSAKELPRALKAPLVFESSPHEILNQLSEKI